MKVSYNYLNPSGGSRVKPGEIFRTERGRRQLEEMSQLTQKLGICRTLPTTRIGRVSKDPKVMDEWEFQQWLEEASTDELESFGGIS